MSKRAYIPTVFIHRMSRDEDGNESYCEDGEIVSVYLRKDFTDSLDHPFDIEMETDFESMDDAEIYARKLAREYQCEIETY